MLLSSADSSNKSLLTAGAACWFTFGRSFIWEIWSRVFSCPVSCAVGIVFSVKLQTTVVDSAVLHSFIQFKAACLLALKLRTRTLSSYHYHIQITHWQCLCICPGAMKNILQVRFCKLVLPGHEFLNVESGVSFEKYRFTHYFQASIFDVVILLFLNSCIYHFSITSTRCKIGRWIA